MAVPGGSAAVALDEDGGYKAFAPILQPCAPYNEFSME
ncbi:hypothetical protein CHELA20_51315 [Hyphomicrobiales bacterium]|nr:hypothetical protein CHELA41_23697 [Hyphomicrobiales bacterium]CAH1675195.1 hypothetical protein CHELA20_51315 [Hyphomicrobiales bacterium]